MPRLWRSLVWTTAAAIAVFAGISVYADLGMVQDSVGELAPGVVLAALGLALGNYVIRFARWQLYLASVRAKAPRSASALVFTAGFTMSVTPGKLGELLKAVLLRDAAGVPVARTAPIVVAERVTDLLALVVLALIGVAAYGVAAPMVAAGAAVTGLAVVVLSSRRLALAILDRIGRLPRVGRLAPRLREMHDHLSSLVRPAPLAWATALGVAAWLCECVGFAVIVRGFPAAHVSLGLATLIYAATTVAGALSFLPGGLLVTEGAMIGLLVATASGLDHPHAVAATIVTRLCTLWFAVALGLVALVILKRLRLAPCRSVEAEPSGEGTLSA